MNIQHVLIEYIHQTWEQVEEYIKEGLTYAEGDYTLEQVKSLVATGQWMLVVALEGKNIKGAMTINFFNRPNDRVAFITTVGGKDIINKNTFSQLKELVVLCGATYMEVAGRDSVMRLLSRQGFKEK